MQCGKSSHRGDTCVRRESQANGKWHLRMKEKQPRNERSRQSRRWTGAGVGKPQGGGWCRSHTTGRPFNCGDLMPFALEITVAAASTGAELGPRLRGPGGKRHHRGRWQTRREEDVARLKGSSHTHAHVHAHRPRPASPAGGKDLPSLNPARSPSGGTGAPILPRAPGLSAPESASADFSPAPRAATLVLPRSGTSTDSAHGPSLWAPPPHGVQTRASLPPPQLASSRVPGP